jgi:hypothetical protein
VILARLLRGGGIGAVFSECKQCAADSYYPCACTDCPDDDVAEYRFSKWHISIVKVVKHRNSVSDYRNKSDQRRNAREYQRRGSPHPRTPAMPRSKVRADRNGQQDKKKQPNLETILHSKFLLTRSDRGAEHFLEFALRLSRTDGVRDLASSFWQKRKTRRKAG